jgi:polyhydroxyalkanoate synthase
VSAATTSSGESREAAAAAMVAGSMLNANPLAGIDRRELAESLLRSLTGLTMRPRAVAGEVGKLARGTAAVIRGNAEIAAPVKDRRFADRSWSENAVYRRWLQLYTLYSGAAQELVDSSGLDSLNSERARFALSLVLDALAPTNSLAGNPAALREAWRTRGKSLLRGARNAIDDLRHNGGMPRQVDGRPFAVGGNLAVSPGAVVYRDEVCEVIQYTPAGTRVRRRPLLVIPFQINKFYVLDLAPGKSLIEYAVANQLQLFAISWRNPTEAQRDWGLDTYIEACGRAVDAVLEVSGSPDCNTVGVCSGGLTMAVFLAREAAQGRKRVHSATFVATVLDTSSPTSLGLFVTESVVTRAIAASRAKGVLDGREMARVFSWLRANDLVWSYWVNNYLLGRDPAAFDILHWNNDSTRLPARLHRDYLDIALGNPLAEAGRLEVLGTSIDLAKVKLPTYVVAGVTDHITPWQVCYETTRMTRGQSEFVLSNSGHIQSIVNPPGNPKARYFAGGPGGGNAAAWLAGAHEEEGSWWPHWLEWVNRRSGAMRPAHAAPGSAAHPPLAVAPGRYVHQR